MNKEVHPIGGRYHEGWLRPGGGSGCISDTVLAKHPILPLDTHSIDTPV